MNAASLRRRITFQKKVLGKDDFGGVTESWVDVYPSVPAAVNSLSAREIISAQAPQAETTKRFDLRYLPGIDQNMRIVFDGQNYNITAVIDPEERHRELQVLATTGLNQG